MSDYLYTHQLLIQQAILLGDPRPYGVGGGLDLLVQLLDYHVNPPDLGQHAYEIRLATPRVPGAA